MNNIEDTNLVERLILQMKDEKNANRKGGIYYITQVELAYNSNRIESHYQKNIHIIYLKHLLFYQMEMKLLIKMIL